MKIKKEDIPTETIRYKPHNAGGYAVSRTYSVKSYQNDDYKKIAREYILKKIKNGWPYDEQFYRTYCKLFFFF